MSENQPESGNKPSLDASDIRRRRVETAAAIWERDDYAESRTREQLNALLHYGHPIPVSHGFTARHVEQNYPGWTWNGLVDVLRAADVFVGRGGSPPCCREEVIRFDFDSVVSWRVVWDDGTVTRGPVPPGAGSHSDPHVHEIPVFDLSTGRMLEVDDRGEPVDGQADAVDH